MGQQQLLLISIGVVLVGVAVVVGINLFSASAIEANRDAVTIHLVTLNAMAQKHFNNPRSFGGGGGTFDNFKIPTKMASNDHGTFEHTDTGHDTDHIHFTGTGKETGENGTDPITIEIRITEDAFEFNKLN